MQGPLLDQQFLNSAKIYLFYLFTYLLVHSNNDIHFCRIRNMTVTQHGIITAHIDTNKLITMYEAAIAI